MVYTLDDLDRIINYATPDLLRRFRLNPVMLAELKKADVLTDSLEDELKADGLSPQTKISKFLGDLKAGPIERFLNFCRILKEGEQSHLLDFLNVDIDRVYAQLGLEPAKPRTPSPDRMELEAAGSTFHTENINVSSGGILLWDQAHPNGGIYLEDDEDLLNKLVEAAPKLKRLVRTKDLWTFLQRYHVMDDMEVEQCQVGTRGDHVDAIIKHLKQAEVWRTHAFFRSLAQMDQAGLIDLVLGQGHKEIYMENLWER